ncbi:MAG: aspartate kinase [Crenarchaeota archaeon]|nr:aspartate kinase [Thermoproteota archaeon]
MKEMRNQNCCKKIVVKFGGSSLGEPERLSKAVAAVVNEAKRGTHIAVVVSAMGKTTDVLLNTAKNTCNGKLEKHDLDDILSMGERTSVRVFAAALRTNGVESRYFDPLDSDWPIVTDTAFQNANPLINECEKRIQEHVLPVVEKGIIPVIAGFVGRTKEGKITTLGRGGSDTTAFLLAEALKTDEVVLVTDAEGIMTGDPKIITTPHRLSEIDVNMLVGLADSGAKFIHTKALKYKPKSINVRVINRIHGDLSKEGTIITGSLSTELDAEIAFSSQVAAITVVGQKISENPQILEEMITKVNNHSSLLGLSVDVNSVILYVAQANNIDVLFNDLHKTIVTNSATKAMAIKKDLVFIRTSGVGLEEKHGVVGKISDVLRINNINIAGILTITSSILLFVDWAQRECALELVRNSLRNNKE